MASNQKGVVTMDFQVRRTSPINKTLPICLRPHIPPNVWEDFLGEVDKVVVNFKRRSLLFLVSGAITCTVGFLIFVIPLFSVDPSDPDGAFPGLAIGSIVMIVGVVLMAWILVLRSKVSKTMTVLCDSTTAKLSTSTLHFREKKHYLYYANFSGRYGHANTSVDYSYWIEVHYDDSISAESGMVPSPPLPQASRATTQSGRSSSRDATTHSGRDGFEVQYSSREGTEHSPHISRNSQRTTPRATPNIGTTSPGRGSILRKTVVVETDQYGRKKTTETVVTEGGSTTTTTTIENP